MALPFRTNDSYLITCVHVPSFTFSFRFLFQFLLPVPCNLEIFYLCLSLLHQHIPINKKGVVGVAVEGSIAQRQGSGYERKGRGEWMERERKDTSRLLQIRYLKVTAENKTDMNK